MGSRCGKTRYKTGVRANQALESIRKRGHRGEDDKKPVRAYACPDCNGWHLTSEQKR